MASGVGRGDAVVTVSHTFIATVEAISQAGADTEFVDIDARTYCMSPDALDDVPGERARRIRRPAGRSARAPGKPIKAIVPVHLYGQVADMDAHPGDRGALRPAGDRGCLPGARRGVPVSGRQLAPRRHVRQGGGVQFLSRQEPRRVRRGGRGDDQRRAQSRRRSRCCASTGRRKKYYHDLEGYNGRLDAIQAAFLRVKLRHLDDWNAQRRAAAARIHEQLSSMPGVTVPFEPEQQQGRLSSVCDPRRRTAMRSRST